MGGEPWPVQSTPLNTIIVNESDNASRCGLYPLVEEASLSFWRAC